MNDNYGTPPYTFARSGAITREFLANLPFRLFNDGDYLAFAGVESPVPMIAEVEGDFESFIVIVDGDTAEMYVSNEDGAFDIVDAVECISELQYGPTKDELIREARTKINELQATLRKLEAQ